MTDTWTEITGSKVPREGGGEHGRPLIIPEGGGDPIPYDRVTSFAGDIDDYYSIHRWQQRLAARGLVYDEDLRQEYKQAVAAGDTGLMNAIIDRAFTAAGGYDKAAHGTEVHALTEAVDRQRGTDPVDVPSEHLDLVTEYLRVVDYPIHGIEEFVVLDDLRVAGTFDRILEVDGRRYIADIKTGTVSKSTTPKMAIQLGLYAHGRRYDPATGQRSDLDVDQSNGIIINLYRTASGNQPKCKLHWINIRAGWEDGAELVQRVRRWRKGEGLTKPLAS